MNEQENDITPLPPGVFELFPNLHEVEPGIYELTGKETNEQENQKSSILENGQVIFLILTAKLDNLCNTSERSGPGY